MMNAKTIHQYVSPIQDKNAGPLRRSHSLESVA